MKTIKDISATQTVLNDDDYFELQENAGTSKKTLWSTIRNTIALFVGAGTTVYKQATYVGLDNDGYSRIEFDTTAGAVTYTLPLMANNIGREITIAFVKNDASADVITISPHATDANKLSNDGLASIILPKVGDFVTFKQSSNSGFWEIVSESITCEAGWDTYAGYGSSETRVFKFTNSHHSLGNLISSNHGSYGTAGLKITILKSGNYFLDLMTWVGAANQEILITRNSSTTTSVPAFNDATVLTSYSVQGGGGRVSVKRYLNKDDIIRFQSNATAPSANILSANIVYCG